MLNEADYNELSRFKDGPAPIENSSQRLQRLIDNKLISPQSYKSVSIGDMFIPAPDKWALTTAGEDAISEFEDIRRQKAANKRQQRFENKVSVLQVLVPFITFILGLIVEHFSGIIGIALQFFR